MSLLASLISSGLNKSSGGGSSGGGGSSSGVDDVFSAYTYIGTRGTQVIPNGIAMASANESVTFSTPTTLPSQPSGTTLTGISFSVNKFVATGYNQTTGVPLYATSTDGSSWSPPTFYGSGIPFTSNAMAVNGAGVFVTVGYDADGYMTYSYSIDGTNWGEPTWIGDSVNPASGFMLGITSFAGKFLAVGYNSLGYPCSSSSTNGANWTTVNLMSGVQQYNIMCAVAVNASGRAVSVGYDSNGYPCAAFSTDVGITWSVPTRVSASAIVARLRAIAVNSAGKFVAVGENSSNQPMVTTSTDGVTWTTPVLVNGYTGVATLRGIAVNSSGKFVAVGTNGTTNAISTTSLDGVVWSTPALMNGSSTNSTMYAVTVNGAGLYVSVGFGNTLAKSTGTSPAVVGYDAMIWTKLRELPVSGGSQNHAIYDSVRGFNTNANLLEPNTTAAAISATGSSGITPLTNGYSMGTDTAWAHINYEFKKYVSWTFRKAPKFFDIIRYTGGGTLAGNGVNRSQNLNHSLGVAPGMVIIKRIASTSDWFVWHRGFPTGAGGQIYNYLKLNLTDGMHDGWVESATPSVFSATTTTLTVNQGSGTSDINALGVDYIAYVFAHDSAADGMIQCGVATGNLGTSPTNFVSLGWEPQFIMFKRTDVDGGEWFMYDTSRGLGADSINSYGLRANGTSAEGLINYVQISATGFSFNYNNPSTVVWMAIRRSNNAPTSGTQVYNAVTWSGSGGTSTVDVGFAPDLILPHRRNGTSTNFVLDRMRGNNQLYSQLTAAEGVNTAQFPADVFGKAKTQVSLGNDEVGAGGSNWVMHAFKRAAGVFDIVCYTGDGASQKNIAHSLGVAPELRVTKSRNTAGTHWELVFGSGPSSPLLFWMESSAAVAGSVSTGDASTFPIYKQSGLDSNTSGTNYVAYLFATKAGISKVGSYTGNGGAQTINCGFSNGARFIMIKRTDVVGDWYVWDSVRGIVAGNDPHLSLNTTVAEVTTNDSVDPDASGYIVNQLAATNINVNAASYIYLAFA